MISLRKDTILCAETLKTAQKIKTRCYGWKFRMEIVDGRDVMDSGLGKLESEEREQEVENRKQTVENRQYNREYNYQK